MSSIADAAYLGNSYGQTYNSAVQFDILTTSELNVAGNILVDGQINGQVKSSSVTGFISAADLLALQASGANCRAFRTTSGAADIYASGAFDLLTDAEKGTLLILPQNAIPIQAIICRTGSTDFVSQTGGASDPLPDILVTNDYNPDAGSTTPYDTGELYTSQTLANFNAGTPLLGNNSGGTADLGLQGAPGLTGDNVVTIETSVNDTYSSADELKIHISYIIVPSAAEFLRNNY